VPACVSIGLVFGSDVVVLLPDAGGNLIPRWRYPETAAIEAGDRDVSRWVYENRQPAGLGTSTFAAAHTLQVPLVGSRETIGVLDVAPRDVDALPAPGQQPLLETFANQIALAVERAPSPSRLTMPTCGWRLSGCAARCSARFPTT
jgi:two-component system sensor histidine kinase KdpD